MARRIAPDEWLGWAAYRVLKHEPERATGLGVDVGEYAEMRSQLEDQSIAGQRDYATSLRWVVNQMEGLDESALTPDQQTGFQVVRSAFSTAVEGLELPYGDVAVGSWRNAPYVVIQNVGQYLALPRFMQSDHKVEDGNDADAYIERMEQMPAVFDGELERIKAARGMGVVPPDFLLDKAIGQMEQTIASAGKGELFADDLRAKLTAMGMPESHANRAKILETGPIAEALDRQLRELRAERAVATAEPGISARPQGDAFYNWALRSSTTTRLTPEQVHQQGLEELEELHARMDPILREIGYTSGSVGDRMQALSQDPRYKFAEGDPGRKQIMDFIAERLDWIRGQMPRAFHTLVDPKMEVRRIPPAEEVGAPGAYGGAGSKDGTIPGRFWINLRTTDLHRKYDLADLTYHEAIPGHVWEGEYSNRLPLIRSILAFNPFSEGWALYGEQIADELGAYDDNPDLADLGPQLPGGTQVDLTGAVQLAATPPRRAVVSLWD